MRINKFVASSSELSRRAADTAIADGRVVVNGTIPSSGYEVVPTDVVKLDGRILTPNEEIVTIMFNKPRGYVVSRDGQGSDTVYDLLPEKYQQLNPVGRLDKDSSGLLLLTNDGVLTQELTHPSHQKVKQYEVTISMPLQPLHRQMISDRGITLEDGVSKLQLERLHDGDDKAWLVTMYEGRNRQIRRTFGGVGYDVQTLHRTKFGPYNLGDLDSGKLEEV